MYLYIIRHGDPDYKHDVLTPLGKRQAQAVAWRLAESGITDVYSSPMGRARETAAPTCELLGLDCHILDWAYELPRAERFTPFPDGVPKSVSEVPNFYYRQGENETLGFLDAFRCQPLAESGMRAALERLEREGNAFLDSLGYRYENGVYRIMTPNDRRVAVFCHSAMGRAWLSLLLRIPLSTMWAGMTYTKTGVTVLEFRNYPEGLTAPRCLCYSDMSHLYAAHESMRYDGGDIV